MGKTEIEWTDRVWNPVRGCSLVSAGCENCYAMKQAHRFAGEGQPYHALTELGPQGARWNGEIMLVHPLLDAPLHWRKPQRIFVNSMSDLFHEDVPFEFIEEVFDRMLQADHTFQILTKRPKRMRQFINSFLGFDHLKGGILIVKNLENIWLGVSVENQQTADERIPLLLDTPAAVRWVSVEPMLGPVDLENVIHPLLAQQHENDPYIAYDVLRGHMKGPDDVGLEKLDWVVVGGESGSEARPMHPDWVRSIRDQCRAAKIPFFFKQWGGVHKKKAGNLLDGQRYLEFPKTIQKEQLWPPNLHDC